MKFKQLYDSKIEEKKELKKIGQKNERTLFILDDLVSEVNMSRNSLISNLYVSLRHANISVINIIQNLTSLSP